MKHLELFSGIGGFRRALDLISVDTDTKFETIGFSEIDKGAIKTYKTVYLPFTALNGIITCLFVLLLSATT